jgi:hypothetical protein
MELPLLKNTWETNKDAGFSLIAVNCYPEEEGALEIFAKYGLTYHHVIDDGKVYKEEILGAVDGFPCSILLDQDHKVINIHYGFTPGDEKELEVKVKALLEL